MPDSTPCSPTDTSGDPCIPPDLPPNFSKWNREHVRVFLQANQEDYGLDEEDIDYIYGNKIMGCDFAKLTEEKLVTFYKLPFGVASRIYELITTLTKPLQRVDTLVTEKNTQLLSDHAVVLFWRSLFLKHPNYPVINSEWIHLNPKVNWMGSDTYEQSVFIRPIYNKFWEMINGSSRLWILTGTPGIGKTFFTFFMFVKIRMTQPNAIIARIYRGKTLIFYPDGTMYRSSGEVPSKVSENAENWVIADAVLPEDEGMYCRTVLVTSPKMAGYGRHRKQGFQERSMPVWNLEELGKVYTQVYKASGLAWEDVESSFELWGGIPRTTLRFINDDAWERTLRTAFTANRMEECMKLDGELSYSSVGYVSGMLVHLVPIDDQYIFTEVRWASRKLCAIVLEVLIEQGKRKAKEIILSTRGIGAYGSLRGYLFENC